MLSCEKAMEKTQSEQLHKLLQERERKIRLLHHHKIKRRLSYNTNRSRSMSSEDDCILIEPTIEIIDLYQKELDEEKEERARKSKELHLKRLQQKYHKQHNQNRRNSIHRQRRLSQFPIKISKSMTEQKNSARTSSTACGTKQKISYSMENIHIKQSLSSFNLNRRRTRSVTTNTSAVLLTTSTKTEKETTDEAESIADKIIEENIYDNMAKRRSQRLIERSK